MEESVILLVYDLVSIIICIQQFQKLSWDKPDVITHRIRQLHSIWIIAIQEIFNTFSRKISFDIQDRTACNWIINKLAWYIKSLTHYARGTQSPPKEAPTACKHSVSGTVSLPSSGCFSPFPHGTCSLSVTYEYLGLEGGPPMFRQDYTCPALLESSSITFAYGAVTRYGRPFQVVLLVEDEALAWSAFARHY